MNSSWGKLFLKLVICRGLYLREGLYIYIEIIFICVCGFVKILGFFFKCFMFEIYVWYIMWFMF